jgi:hypothetical protein
VQVASETLVKLEILTRGVVFSREALDLATSLGSKRQNVVYNLPEGASGLRPQELWLEGADGYTTVCSCVSNIPGREPVIIDSTADKRLVAMVEGRVVERVNIEFVKEPSYYRKSLSTGESVKQYITACGYDELNILPWQGCAISKACRFCGINTVSKSSKVGAFTAFDLSDGAELWNAGKSEYFTRLLEAVRIAVADQCYSSHAHVIIISGNLADASLNLQAQIYSEIASVLSPVIQSIAAEGLVAVITPPHDKCWLERMRYSGIDIVVFNLEVGNEP